MILVVLSTVDWSLLKFMWWKAPDLDPMKPRKPIKQQLMYGTVDTHIFNDTPEEANLRLVDESKKSSQRYDYWRRHIYYVFTSHTNDNKQLLLKLVSWEWLMVSKNDIGVLLLLRSECYHCGVVQSWYTRSRITYLILRSTMYSTTRYYVEDLLVVASTS